MHSQPATSLHTEPIQERSVLLALIWNPDCTRRFISIHFSCVCRCQTLRFIYDSATKSKVRNKQTWSWQLINQNTNKAIRVFQKVSNFLQHCLNLFVVVSLHFEKISCSQQNNDLHPHQLGTFTEPFAAQTGRWFRRAGKRIACWRRIDSFWAGLSQNSFFLVPIDRAITPIWKTTTKKEPETFVNDQIKFINCNWQGLAALQDRQTVMWWRSGGGDDGECLHQYKTDKRKTENIVNTVTKKNTHKEDSPTLPRFCEADNLVTPTTDTHHTSKTSQTSSSPTEQWSTTKQQRSE